MLSQIIQILASMWQSAATSSKQMNTGLFAPSPSHTPRSSISNDEFFTPSSRNREHVSKSAELCDEEEEMPSPDQDATDEQAWMTEKVMGRRRRLGRFHEGRFYLDEESGEDVIHLEDISEDMSHMPPQEVILDSRDVLAHDQQQHHDLQSSDEENMAAHDENHGQAASATEKFPEWIPDNEAYPFEFSVTDMGRSRTNTYQRVFMPRNLKSRSMSHAEMASEVMSDSAVADVHTSLKELPAPPSLTAIRTRRATIKVDRRALINNVIRPRTKKRAIAILERPRDSFVSDTEYVQLNETAKNVIAEVVALDERARKRDQEVLREQNIRAKREEIRAAEAETISASLRRMQKRWASGDQVRDVTQPQCEEGKNAMIASTLAALTQEAMNITE